MRRPQHQPPGAAGWGEGGAAVPRGGGSLLVYTVPFCALSIAGSATGTLGGNTRPDLQDGRQKGNVTGGTDSAFSDN